MGMTQQDGKIAAGRKAAEWIENGMIVGLGTGSTAECFIDHLIERCKKGLSIKAVASSHASAERARKGGIPVEDINSVPRIDLTVDGADEIDLKKRMIKGGGGAHVREKILACASNEMVVIVDESKCVDSIGKCKLPVEVLFFGSPATRLRIETLGFKGKWRIEQDGTLFLSENGNLIFDIAYETLPVSPEKDHEKLIQVPGVIDTGFFFHLAGRVIVGLYDGSVEVR